MRKELVGKILVLAVILLFVGVGVNSAIANDSKLSIICKKDATKLIYDDDTLSEYSFEVCGLEKTQTYGIMLSNRQIEEFELLIDEVNNELINTETKDESVKIFKNAMQKIDEIGLFPDDFSVEQAQQLIDSLNFDKGINRLPVDSFYKKQEKSPSVEDKENFDCFIMGITGISRFFGSRVAFGFVQSYEDEYGSNHYAFFPGTGRVVTYGSNGQVSWQGEFYGQLDVEVIDFLWSQLFHQIGVVGFIGFRWPGFIFTLMFGIASHVHVGPEPYDYW
jgi:hypothetical protein